jgi:hypothetical protein
MRIPVRTKTVTGAGPASRVGGSRQDPIFHEFDVSPRPQARRIAPGRLLFLRSGKRQRSGKPDTYRNQSPSWLISRLSSAADGFLLCCLSSEELAAEIRQGI